MALLYGFTRIVFSRSLVRAYYMVHVNWITDSYFIWFILFLKFNPLFFWSVCVSNVTFPFIVSYKSDRKQKQQQKPTFFFFILSPILSIVRFSFHFIALHLYFPFLVWRCNFYSSVLFVSTVFFGNGLSVIVRTQCSFAIFDVKPEARRPFGFLCLRYYSLDSRVHHFFALFIFNHHHSWLYLSSFSLPVYSKWTKRLSVPWIQHKQFFFFFFLRFVRFGLFFFSFDILFCFTCNRSQTIDWARVSERTKEMESKRNVFFLLLPFCFPHSAIQIVCCFNFCFVRLLLRCFVLSLHRE